MLKILLLSSVFSFVYTEPVQANNHNIYVFDPRLQETQQMIELDNETGQLNFVFIPLANLPTPLMSMSLKYEDGTTIQSLGYPNNWTHNAPDTSAFMLGYTYTFSLPYNDTQPYFNQPVYFYYNVVRSSNVQHNFYLNISYNFNGYIGEGGDIEGAYNRGYSDGYDAGESIGYIDGLTEGRDLGYIDGYNTAIEGQYTGDWFKSVFKTLGDLLNVELFPGLSIGYVVALPLILALVAFIIGWFK